MSEYYRVRLYDRWPESIIFVIPYQIYILELDCWVAGCFVR